MIEKRNIRGTLRTMNIGEDFRVPLIERTPEYLRSMASGLKAEGHGTFTVNWQAAEQSTLITRIA